MIPADFPEGNIVMNKPADWDESQCGAIKAFKGEAKGGTLDGCPIFVCAWQPTGAELEVLNAGGLVYLTWCSEVLAPHKATVNFHNAAILG